MTKIPSTVEEFEKFLADYEEYYIETHLPIIEVLNPSSKLYVSMEQLKTDFNMTDLEAFTLLKQVEIKND